MLSVTLRLLSLVALGAAQTALVSIWVPPTNLKPALPVDAKNLAASIVGSAANLTTYVLGCGSQLEKATSVVDKTTTLSGFDANPPDLACVGFSAPYTIVQGPSTVMWNYTITGANPFEASVTTHSGGCSRSGTTEAVCTTTDGTRSPQVNTYRADKMYTPFAVAVAAAVAAGTVTSTPPPISASTTEHTQKEANSSVLHAGIDSGADSTTRDPSAGTKAMSGSSGLSVFHTGSIAGISSVKASAPTSAPPKSTNIGVQRSSAHRDGVFGALVIALAGAIL